MTLAALVLAGDDDLLERFDALEQRVARLEGVAE
jgi:hypothetical protein